MEQSETSAERMYAERAAGYEAQVATSQRQAGLLANIRVAVFLAAAASMGAGLYAAEWRTPWIAFAVALLLLFAWLVRLHGRRVREVERYRLLVAMHQAHLARCRRKWGDIPPMPVSVPAEHAAMARDLDLFGGASLWRLLCLAYTSEGVRTLRDRLLAPSSVQTIGERQAAVRRLAGEFEYREELELRGLELRGTGAQPDRFVAWAESPRWLVQRPWLRWASRLLPLAVAVLLAVDQTGVWPQRLWMLLMLVNVAIGFRFALQIHGTFDQVSNRNGEIQRYRALLEWARKAPDDFPALQRIQTDLTRQGLSAHEELTRLQRVADASDARFNAMVHLLFQAVFLYDLHVLAALERWQARCGPMVRSWFQELGELEALASLAGLAHDEPDWAFPVFAEGQPIQIEGESVGHPLLTQSQRVCNDIELGPPGSFLMVTGSNMSGKSTYLRSIGVNVLLAQAGGPVCARRFQLPPLRVATSMRVQDSLEQAVSFFMAELRRLKEVVDEATNAQATAGPAVLYLLDEILQGTNSRDRRTAVRAVVSHLLRLPAIGAISTHDLELAEGSELDAASRKVHFRETIETHDGQSRMRFDYQLRPGLAETTNAMELLALVGL